MEDTSNIDIFICDDDFNISDDDGDQNDDNAEKDGDNHNESHDSVTILENFDLNDILKEVEDTNSLLDVMDELKNAENNERNINDVIDTTQNNDTITQSLVDNNKTGDFNNIGNSNIDSQQTILYTVHGFTDNTHISQSQEDLVIANKHLLNRSNTEECILNDLPTDAIKEVHSNEIKRKEFISNENTQFQMETEFSDDSNEQMQTVSIKTLKELNKVKCYLNKKERYFSDDCNSLDSGFKSSQPRSSYKSGMDLNSSQFSEIRINESAHCLLSFLSESQFSESTAEIAEEISKILGKLVDKLHEEENYPNFLEDMLEQINMLLDDIYEGNDEGPNTTLLIKIFFSRLFQLLERDATIHRLLLLNRSTHIIHYTLEKIVAILEKSCTAITNDIYELKNVEKAENLCYIFHILEVILKRLKNTNQLSQISIPNSQEDRILKKSSLTDMWRKKWNLEKCVNFEGSAKKNCILTLCSSVLNKIIVQAMDGYSLISYAALQCFNLLQN
ncbi:repetitive organellar protein [Bicyclus anynana]|uniref:Repetitive organellar protein n=1 Tax=Bicyclus anynana TaxID=110368 RepID=A0ABM3M510_BICAN|nr:repetitive organellar protein [Bicyclus anynana]